MELDVSALDGTNGFKIEGTDVGDYAGSAVAGAGVSVDGLFLCADTGDFCPRAVASAASAAAATVWGIKMIVVFHLCGESR